MGKLDTRAHSHLVCQYASITTFDEAFEVNGVQMAGTKLRKHLVDLMIISANRIRLSTGERDFVDDTQIKRF